MKKFFEKYDLFKIVCLAILVTVVLTWIIPSPTVANGMAGADSIKRVGLVDLFSSGVYGVNFFLQQILLVLFVGVFYGVLSKSSGYQVLVSRVASKLKGKESLFVIFSSAIIALLTSLLSQTFVVLIFIPLIISIASKMKLDKLTTMLCSFGAILVGIVGATFGTEGVSYFINYLSMYDTTIDIKTLLGIRFGILALALILYNFFTLLHLKKARKNNKEEMVLDLFEGTEENKKAKVWPMVLFLIVLFSFTILGYMNWEENFGLTLFREFHEWLTELAIDKYTIISYILGSRATYFGFWELYQIFTVMGVLLLFVKIIYRIKLDDFIEEAIDGLRKMAKPALLMFLIFTVFVFIYWTPFTYTLSKGLIGETFNPFLTAVSGFVSALFHLDFGYTSYLLGELMTTNFGNSLDVGFLIYVTMNGMVQIIAPTSALLFIGLSYLDLPYKNWMKGIWKFFIALFILLFIIFALLSYL